MASLAARIFPNAGISRVLLDPGVGYLETVGKETEIGLPKSETGSITWHEPLHAPHCSK